VSKKINITSAQIRAARALLNWSARELADRSGVSQSSIHRAERAEARPSMHETGLAALKATLERYGVEFLEASGVRLGAIRNAGEPTVNVLPTKRGAETFSAWDPAAHRRRRSAG